MKHKQAQKLQVIVTLKEETNLYPSLKELQFFDDHNGQMVVGLYAKL